MDQTRTVSSLQEERFPWLSPFITLMMVVHTGNKNCPTRVNRAATVESKVNLLCAAIQQDADVLALCTDGHDSILIVDDLQGAMAEIWRPGYGALI